jgi:methyl-accepting chemotaxis protein
MKYFENLSIRTKLFLSFGLIWVLLIAIIIIAYRGITGIAESETHLAKTYYEPANLLVQLRSHQNHNRADILEMMLTNDTSMKESLQKALDERAIVVNETIDELASLNPDPDFQMKLKILKEDLEKYRIKRGKQVLLSKSGNLIEAQEMSSVLQSQLHEKIRIQIYELAEAALLEASEHLVIDQKQANGSIIVFVIVGLVTLILSFFMILILNNTVAKPLNDIAIMATTIASGDLSVEVSSTYRTDEVGRLKLAFNDMVNNLKESIKDISEGVVALGSSSSEILAATSQVSASAIETATAISQTSTTVEEVRQASQLSSEKAGRVAQNAQETASVTQTGIEAVGKTIEVMQIVQNQMEAITKTIVRLSEQSQQIGGIIASVNDVADQSTLLAVNAAIEASKAGEQGKGFTVVAQEIKNLSLRSKKATTQVRNILSDVQKATTAAVMSTEQGTKAVADAVSQSTQAGETIHILSKSVNEFLQAAAQIVASNQQQVVGMDQVGLAMNSINQAGAENAASMKQAENSAKDLNELGIKLKLLVDQYKM